MPVITNIEDLRVLAQKRVPRMFYDYADSGSWTESTYRANESDFQKIKLRQRVAVNMEGRTTRSTMIGQDVAMPVAIAPVGLTGMQWADGEILAARGLALAWARERKAVLPTEFYGARLQSVRARSFAIAGLAALDQVQQVMDSLAEATASGQTLREWQKGLPASVFELGKARRELIFRNAVQTHYGIGRSVQQRENAAARP